MVFHIMLAWRQSEWSSYPNEVRSCLYRSFGVTTEDDLHQIIIDARAYVKHPATTKGMRIYVYPSETTRESVLKKAREDFLQDRESL